MPVPAAAVAAALRARLPGVGVKKLHKLLYYCQGHHLAARGEPLFTEAIVAWDMGPVVGQLWRAEKDDGVDDGVVLLDEAAVNTVGYVVSRYGALSGKDLEVLTHHESPWLEAGHDRAPAGTARIDIGSLRNFFATRTDTDDDLARSLDQSAVRAWLSGAQSRRTDPLLPDDRDEIRQRLSGW